MAATQARPQHAAALSSRQRRQYDEAGYLVVEDLLSPEEVEVVKERVALLARHRDNRDAIDDGTMYFQKVRFILEPAVTSGAVAPTGGLADVRKMGQPFLDPVIMETLVLNPRILPAIQRLLGYSRDMCKSRP